MDHDLAANVTRGARFLDSYDPAWWRRLNLTVRPLCMANPCACVLGQLYGNFHRHMLTLSRAGLVDANYLRWVRWHGFTDSSLAWDELAALWCAAITERQSMDKTQE
jgi:hypothetical protein